MRFDLLSECAGTLADARRAIEASQARMRRTMDAIKADPACYERWLEGLRNSTALLARADAEADARCSVEEKVAAE